MRKKTLFFALTLAIAACLTVPALAAGEPGTVGKPVVISSNSETIAMIDKNDALWMWGLREYGMMGNNLLNDDPESDNNYETQPLKVMEHVRSVVVSSGSFVAAVKTDNSLWMWGLNYDGHLGNGGAGVEYKNRYGQTYTIQPVPVKIMDDVAAVCCGPNNAAAIKTDGSLWTWGNNVRGQIGNGTLGEVEKPQTTPVKVLDDVATVCFQDTTTAAVKKDGSLWMWGQNISNALNNGQKGNYMLHNTAFQTVPLKVMDGVKSVYNHGWETPLVLKTDGTLVTWSENAGYKDSPDNGWAIESLPIQPTEPLPLITVAKDVADVSTSGADTFFTFEVTALLKKDGTLWMYGGNEYGELGVPELFGKDHVDRQDAVQVKGLLWDTSFFAVIGNNVAVVDEFGDLWGWGDARGLLMCLSPQRYSGTKSFQRINYVETTYCVKSPALLKREFVKNLNAPPPAPGVMGFSDVWSSSPFEDSIVWAVLNGITKGTSKTTFGVSDTCTHNHILTFLWRANESPAAEGASDFEKAASWARSQGLIDGSFDGSKPCTRSQAMTYLWKLAGSPKTAVNNTFTDVPASAPYAQAVAWAVERNITKGTGNGSFSPNNPCTRGQIVTFLYRDDIRKIVDSVLAAGDE